MFVFLLPLLAVALILMPLVPVYSGIKTGKKAKNAIIFNMCAFFGVMIMGVVLPIGDMVMATGASAVVEAVSMGQGMGYLAAALVTGLSCVGAGIAVAAAAPAAIGACSEDAKNFGKAVIFVALGEGVALYGLLVSILIINSL